MTGQPGCWFCDGSGVRCCEFAADRAPEQVNGTPTTAFGDLLTAVNDAHGEAAQVVLLVIDAGVRPWNIAGFRAGLMLSSPRWRDEALDDALRFCAAGIRRGHQGGADGR